MKRFPLLALAALLLLGAPNAALALSVTCSDNFARVGNTVTARISAQFTQPPTCQPQINWGDGSGWVGTDSCTSSMSCTVSAGHQYTRTGVFTVSAKVNTLLAGCSTVVAPSQNSTALTVCNRLQISTTSLPAGYLHMPYSQQIQTITGGQKPITFRMRSGALPPGLTLAGSGLISGTPTVQGTFRFTVGAYDNCVGADPVEAEFFITVGPPRISVKLTPSLVTVRFSGASTKALRYTFSSTITSPVSLLSSRGYFLAGSQVLGQVSTPLSVTLNNGSAVATESLTIPASVLDRARRMGLGGITFQRGFAMQGTDVVSATLTIRRSTGPGADLQPTRLELYYENRRAEITVRRNQPGLRAYADLSYVGSGLLQGYWEIDGRNIQPVSMHLTPAKRTVTLETPKAPALPTFTLGTHRVRFVITTPAMDIDFPVALYYVTAEPYEKVYSIITTLPAAGSEQPYAPLEFKWTAQQSARAYILEILDSPEGETLVTAQIVDRSYTLPEVLLKRHLKPSGTYYWRVRALDDKGSVVAESRTAKFTLR